MSAFENFGVRQDVADFTRHLLDRLRSGGWR